MLGLFLVAYALLQVGVRLLVPHAVEHDEAEQLLLAQSLALGYGQHPPLYTWLQYGIFRLLGVGVLGLAGLKHACLLGVYGGTYLAARHARSTPALASLTMLSLWLMPAVVWEAQRDLTHSILAAALAPVAISALVALAVAPTAGRYIVLGGVLGLGVLSKYNFALFAAVLLGSALSVPRFRSVLLDRRTALLGLAGGAVAGPHLAWLPSHSTVLAKLELTRGHLETTPGGLAHLLVDLAAFLGPLVLVVALFAPGVRRPAPDPDPLRHDVRRLLERYLLVLVGVLLLSVPLLGLRTFKARWLLPLLVLAPLALGLRLPATGPEADAARRLIGICVAAGLLTMGLRLGALQLGPAMGVPSRLHLPVAELAAQIREAGFQRGILVAADTPLGGNLRLHFPESLILTPGTADLAVPPSSRPRQCLVVWRDRQDPALTVSILAFAGSWLGRSPFPDAVVAIHLPRVGSGHPYAVNLARVAPGPPPCEAPLAPRP